MRPTPATPIRTPTKRLPVPTSGAMTTPRTPAKRRLGLGGPRLGGGAAEQPAQSPSKRLRLGPSKTNGDTPKMTREAASATFHGWKDVDLIVKTSVVVGEDDDDDLNEGFCHYSIMDDE